MAYKNTGYQRSLTLVVKRLEGGVAVDTTTYDGRLAFGSYNAITDESLARMSQQAYEQRLAAFIAYVEGLVPGLDVSAVTEPGLEARRENLTACPID